MKRSVISLVSRIIPEEGRLKEFALRFYNKLITPPQSKNLINKKLSASEQSRFKDAVRIGFIGDLILLRDMIEAGKADGEYNYGEMFELLKSYFSECDFMTGVLEGPLPGDKLSYTTANYGDGRDLRCGYPDNFLEAVKESGIDFVTVANNHLYDKGSKGMERTIAKLESESMSYVGYGAKARTLVEVKGLKIAVLAYTYGFNGKCEKFFFQAGNENLPHLIRPKGSKVYKQCLSRVKEDFEWATAQNPDCIMVYPHVGEQFLHAPDKNQLHWFDIFKSLGADVILGCHSHATQPLRFEDGTLCLYCPGNFVNNYFPRDGDASAMVEVYLDKLTGKPFAASVIPIWAYGSRQGLLCAMPISEMAGNNELSWHEWFRLKDAQKVVTNSMLGVEIPIDQSQKRYVILSDNKYRRLPYEKNKGADCGEVIPKIFDNVSIVVFIGDSITEGTKNGGYGWFEPMMAAIPDKEVVRYAKGSSTAKTILDLYGDSLKETEADLFFVAIGCNDIRYRDEAICSMTASEYRDNIMNLVTLIKGKNLDADVVLIAPWHSDDVYDKFCRVDNDKKHKLYVSYTTALENIAKETGCFFINPNRDIWNKINSGIQTEYLIDWIHPNAAEGVILFSEAVIKELSLIDVG